MESNQIKEKVWVKVTILVSVIGGLFLLGSAVIGIVPDLLKKETISSTAVVNTQISTLTNEIFEYQKEKEPTITPDLTENIIKLSPTQTVPEKPPSCKSGGFTPDDYYALVQFSYDLNEDDFINGQCSVFEGGGVNLDGGVAYIILGPGDVHWFTMHGWWNVCNGVTQEEVQYKLDWQANSLEENLNTSTGVATRIVCLYENGSMSCEVQ